ncbi:MAG: nucleotidyltransferase domain-containing protein [Bacillota bacterium]|nr:nucleotidyltransferase domain-containing protein [Bacillota bacterium]MDD3850709.1 nucleotidyltransferase domain-containing protein [Bacillota bacterium]MDD4707969.1 nucleotidyltransferase domain-containing protein [Bacillota bacterium]
MLTSTEIRDSIIDIAEKYPIKKLSLFGSFAQGKAKNDSDIDILVEFKSKNISLIMLCKIKDEIENKLNRKIDLIHAPIEEGSLIKIDKVVDIYEQ